MFGGWETLRGSSPLAARSGTPELPASAKTTAGSRRSASREGGKVGPAWRIVSLLSGPRVRPR